MRILLFSGVFPPKVGGIETHVAYLSQSLVQAGHQVKIVTSYTESSGSPYFGMHKGIPVFRIPTLPLPKTRTVQFLCYSLFFMFWELLWWRPDIIHFHTFWPEIFLAKFLNHFCAIVYTVHESRFLSMAENQIDQHHLKTALEPVDALIAPSTELLQVAQRFCTGPKLAKYIPNGVDADLFNLEIKKEIVREHLKINHDAPLLLCPRRLVTKNGVEYFLKSLPSILEKNNQVRAIVAGDGPEGEHLKSLALSLGLGDELVFVGSIANDKMPMFYSAADIVVLPSLKEATSIAGLEAMACGKPVVATNVGGLPEIIENNKTGLLVPSQDSQALTDAILRLVESPELGVEIGAFAREHVEKNFSWSKVAEETVQLYQSIYNKKYNRNA